MRAANFLTTTFAGVLGFGLICAAGCKSNTVDKGAFKSAIDNYLSSQQDCLWSTPIKFPVQADTNNDEQTRGYDALVDAGLLTRGSAEKKRFLIGSKQVNDYDLSDKGRSAWTTDQTQPGYGNFCFGHPTVTAIDNYTPADPDAVQYTVNYRYGLHSLPDWANSIEMKTAYPKLSSESSGQRSGSAQLAKSNNGWLVSNVQPAPASQSM